MSDRYSEQVEQERNDWRNSDPFQVAASVVGAAPHPVIPDEDAREVAEFLGNNLLALHRQSQLMAAEINGINKVYEICRMQLQAKTKGGGMAPVIADFPNGLNRKQRRDEKFGR